MDHPSISNLIAFAESELAKAREANESASLAPDDVLKWRDLLEGLYVLRERQQRSSPVF